MAPAKPINNLNNEVGIKLWSDRKKFYFPVNDTFFLIKYQLDLKTLEMFLQMLNLEKPIDGWIDK